MTALERTRLDCLKADTTQDQAMIPAVLGFTHLHLVTMLVLKAAVFLPALIMEAMMSHEGIAGVIHTVTSASSIIRGSNGIVRVLNFSGDNEDGASRKDSGVDGCSVPARADHGSDDADRQCG